MVVSTNPLLVAAYTDEMDCIALLQFPDALVPQYHLTVGQRLLTVNLYAFGQVLVRDLEHGPASYHRYTNFRPYIAEFLSDDLTRIETRKTQISEAEWVRTSRCAQDYLAKHGKKARDGRPMYCETPAEVHKVA